MSKESRENNKSKPPSRPHGYEKGLSQSRTKNLEKWGNSHYCHGLTQVSWSAPWAGFCCLIIFPNSTKRWSCFGRLVPRPPDHNKYLQHILGDLPGDIVDKQRAQESTQRKDSHILVHRGFVVKGALGIDKQNSNFLSVDGPNKQLVPKRNSCLVSTRNSSKNILPFYKRANNMVELPVVTRWSPALQVNPVPSSGNTFNHSVDSSCRVMSIRAYEDPSCSIKIMVASDWPQINWDSSRKNWAGSSFPCETLLEKAIGE